MNDIIKSDEMPRPRREPKTMLALIGDLARDVTVSPDRLRGFLDMKRANEADEAKKAFIRAKIKMAPSMPVVQRNGKIEITEKGRPNVVIQSTPFAKFEDIHEMAMPVLWSHGFDLDFRTGYEDGRTVVTAVLSHRDGHTESTSMHLPLDSSGSKNNVQGVGSALSYGKRYTMCALLNIRTTDKAEFDDDGYNAGKLEGPPRLDADQIEALQNRIDATGSNLAIFLEVAKAESLQDIRADQYDFLVGKLEAKAARKAKPVN